MGSIHAYLYIVFSQTATQRMNVMLAVGHHCVALIFKAGTATTKVYSCYVHRDPL